jgi:hypothetical protein
MNEKITQISSKRSISDEFTPVWNFNGTVYFEGPLSEEQRKTVEEIIFGLNALLERKE